MPSTPPSLAKPSPLPPARSETLLLLFSRSPYCSQPTPSSFRPPSLYPKSKVPRIPYFPLLRDSGSRLPHLVQDPFDPSLSLLPFCRMSLGFQGPSRIPGVSPVLSPTPSLSRLELERLSPAAFSRAAPATPAPGARGAPRRGSVYRTPGSHQSASLPQPGRPLRLRLRHPPQA